MTNIRSVIRLTLDDLPPIATDDELMAWSRELCRRPSRPNRPLVATRTTSRISMHELLSEIEALATAVYTRRTSAFDRQPA